VRCLPPRLGALLVSFSLCLLVLRRFPILPVQASKDDLLCAYSLNAPKIDGAWTSPDEWLDATEFKVSYAHLGGEELCVFRLKHDGSRLFILADLVTSRNPRSMYTEVLVGVDVNGQGGVTPQDDDYLFWMLFTSESYGIVETILYSQGNGVAWVKPKYFTKICPVAGSGVGNYSGEENPYSSEAHWLCEMEISLRFLGAREIYGFYISAYNSDSSILFALPKAGSVERPESWGKLVGLRFPDLLVARVWIGDASGRWLFPKPGQEYFFWVEVGNNGTAWASGCTLSFRIVHEDHPQHQEMYSGFVESSEPLHPRQSRRLSLYVPGMYSWLRRLGEHQVKVTVNEDRATPELNYRNNELVKSFLVDYGYILTVRVPYQGVIVMIDGRSYVSDGAGEVKEALMRGRHTIEVPGLAFPLRGVELKFLSFGDGYNATVRPFDLSDDAVFEVRYGVRFLLEVESKYGPVSGAGWLPARSSANLSVAPSVDYGNGTRMVFVRWLLPGNVSHFEYAAKVQMNGPTKVQILWKRQFLLTVKSEFGSPRGGGWYDEGSIATFWVDQVSGVLIVHKFHSWEGDVSASTFRATVLMNSPKEVRALWTTDYTAAYVLFAYVLVMALFAGFIAYRIQRQRRMRAPPRRRYKRS